jgi:arsenite/tail-anchored protein-transporting ATPase
MRQGGKAAPSTRPRPRLTFFAGKGGVGKTTCAAAAAVRAAAEGRRVLAVSTDPAHSLGDALGTRLDRRPREIAPDLSAVQLDADRALSRWLGRREGAFRTIADRGTYLDREDIDQLLSLSLPGVDELVGLVELARLSRLAPWDDVVVDTAPTGHTLRLLEMPETLQRLAQVLDDMHAKHRFLSASLGGAWRPDFADRTIAGVEAQARSLRAMLLDPARCSFTWVTLPEALAIDESKMGVEALGALGVCVAVLVVNRVWPAPDRPCPLCSPRFRDEARGKQRIEELFHGLRILEVPAMVHEPVGVGALLDLASDVRVLRNARASSTRVSRREPATPAAAPNTELPIGRDVELVLVGGKGGVGKTTIACASAIAMASREPERTFLLISTDPAHSLGDAMCSPLGDEARNAPGAPRNLWLRELDAKAAFERERERYRGAIDDVFSALFRGSMDASFDHAVLRDLLDLAPPGLDELFALVTISSALSRRDGNEIGRSSLRADRVVVDTAPTGHTLRLLALPETALAWVHAIMRIILKYRRVIGLGQLAEDLTRLASDLRQLSLLLHDRERASFVVVTRPAELPRVETERLLRRLRSLSVPASALIVNSVTQPSCRRCEQAADEERPHRERLSAAAAQLGIPVMTVPARYPPPRGVSALRGVFRSLARIR